MRRPSRAQVQRLVDVAIPVGVGLMLFLVVLGDQSERRLYGFGLLLAVVQGAALWWRRAYPERVMAIALAGGLAFQLLVPSGVVPFAGLFALGTLASLRPPRVSLIALAALLGVAALSFVSRPPEDGLFALAVVALAWALGEAIRNRRMAIEEAARGAVTAEQARIARELHDLLAHTVSVIVVQASAAAHVFDARPEQARAALSSIEAGGREALRELRLLLGAIRSPDGGEPEEPQPGLDRLDELAESVRAAGLHVVVRREGPAAALSAGVDLSAYRIVQEALTNTLRHAGASRADVTVRFGDDVVEVDVSDDGCGAPPGPTRGHGILGMRERASLVGGTLEAGPSPRGGYRVHACLPLETVP